MTPPSWLERFDGLTDRPRRVDTVRPTPRLVSSSMSASRKLNKTWNHGSNHDDPEPDCESKHPYPHKHDSQVRRPSKKAGWYCNVLLGKGCTVA